MSDSPSARLIAAANETLSLVDGEGRTISVRRLGALDKLRLFKAVGPQLAQNAPYLGMAMLAASVSAIDAVPIPWPTNEAQIEAIVSRLGDGGIAAIAAALVPDEMVEPEALRDQAGN